MPDKNTQTIVFKKGVLDKNRIKEVIVKNLQLNIMLYLIYYEIYKNKKEAKRREKYFKTTKGKTTFKIMLKEYLKI